MIVVTGGAGFIGSNLVRSLNSAGEDDILVVDDLSDGSKFANLRDLRIADYLDRDDFLARVNRRDRFGAGLRAILHQGACSDTMELDGRRMMRDNFEYSKSMLGYCIDRGIALVYASSASVYGAGPGFSERPDCERPLNVYGYSKLLFDQYVRQRLASLAIPVVGLRYFNVYGPREAHKGRMASVAFQLDRQLSQGDRVRLFTGSGGYGPGEQRRDFIQVKDVAAVVNWFLGHPDVSGIFNVGTGACQSFNDVAAAVVAWHGRGRVEYIDFPDGLEARYQSYTEADMRALRGVGCDHDFMDVQAGVRQYLDELHGDASMSSKRG